MNHRIRASGGTVWFTPDLQVIYRPRPERATAGAPILRVRTVATTGGARASRDTQPCATWPHRWPSLASLVGTGAALGLCRRTQLAARGTGSRPLGYAALVVGASGVTAAGLDAAARRRLPLVYATMHGAWGIRLPHQSTESRARRKVS